MDIGTLMEHVLTNEEVRTMGDYKGMVEVLERFKPGEYVFIEMPPPPERIFSHCRYTTFEDVIQRLQTAGLCIGNFLEEEFHYVKLSGNKPLSAKKTLMVYRRRYKNGT